MEFEKKVIELDVNDVLPNRFQPRIKFNEDSINELSDSIKEHGVIQPIVVRAMGDKYEIIAGERRYKASLLAGKNSIPAVITNLNDKDSAEVALIENVQRKDLTPIEEAISYKKILDMGYLTQEELAVKLGKSQSTVANKLRLLNLDEEVQDAVLDEKISERHARSLLKLSDYEEQKKLLKKIIENRLTVRKTDEEIEKILKGNNESSDDTVDVLKPIFTENPFKLDRIQAETLPAVSQINETKFPNSEPIIILDEEGQIPAIAEDDIALTGAPVAPENISIDPILGIPVAAPSAIVEPAIPADLAVNNTTAPGFMNIEQIENNAQDIIQEAKQPADMNSLLTAAPSNEPDAPAPEEELKVGKFFTLPTEENNEPGVSPDAIAAPTSAFDFQMSPVDAPAPAAAPAVVEPAIPTDLGLAPSSAPTPAPAAAPTVSIEALMSSMPVETPAPAPAVAPETISETPAAEVVATPEVLTAAPEVVAEPVVEAATEVVAPVEETPAIPAANEAPVASVVPEATPSTPDDLLASLVPGNVELPAAPEVATTPAAETITAAPEVVAEPVVAPEVAPVAEVVETPAPVIQEVAPVQAVMPATVDVTPTLTVPAPDAAPEVSLPGLTPETPAVPADTSSNVGQAVNNVRNCIEGLEKTGYLVDTEEFDFEGEYQIIIKIKK